MHKYQIIYKEGLMRIHTLQRRAIIYPFLLEHSNSATILIRG